MFIHTLTLYRVSWVFLLIVSTAVFIDCLSLCLFQANMTTSIDRDKIREAYEDVRSDNSETEW
jgi:hypothetical protein